MARFEWGRLNFHMAIDEAMMEPDDAALGRWYRQFCRDLLHQDSPKTVLAIDVLDSSRKQTEAARKKTQREARETGDANRHEMSQNVPPMSGNVPPMSQNVRQCPTNVPFSDTDSDNDSSSMDLGFKEEEKESKEQFTREEENGNKFDKQSRESGAGTNHGKGRFASGESQGGQHGAGVEGVAGEGEAGAENHCAEGEEDRRAFSDDQEQKRNIRNEGLGMRGELARLQADPRKSAIQADTGEAQHTSGLPDSAETRAVGRFCANPYEYTTDIEKSPRARVSGHKKAIALGKSALEMEYPDAWRLWEVAPKVARVRSSTMQVLQAWTKALKTGMPPIDEIMASMGAWKGSKKWAEHGGEYIEGLHRWIANRQWENDPASSMQIATEQAREVDRMITEGLNRGY